MHEILSCSKNYIYSEFWGIFLYVCAGIRTILATWLRSVSQSGQFHAAEIFLRPDNSRFGGHIHFGWFSGVLRVCARPVDPDPGDVVTNPTGAVPAKTNTPPIKPDCPLPKPTAAPLSGDMAPCVVQTHTPATDTLTAPTTINPVRTSPTSAVTVDPDPACVALTCTGLWPPSSLLLPHLLGSKLIHWTISRRTFT
jgi:hypothetical protein